MLLASDRVLARFGYKTSGGIVGEVGELRLAFQVVITIILSAALGLGIASLASGPSKPFLFSQCNDYPLNSPPSSCGPLAPILLLVASCLLILAFFNVFRNRLRKGKTTR
jgi:hypothetical protein